MKMQIYAFTHLNNVKIMCACVKVADDQVASWKLGDMKTSFPGIFTQ